MKKNFWQLKYRRKIILYVLLKFILLGIGLLPPYYYMIILEEVIIKYRLDLFAYIAGLYIVTYIMKFIVQFWSKFIYNKIFPEIEMDCKNQVMKKYCELNIEILEQYTAGELQERVLQDSKNISLYYLKNVDNIIASINALLYAIILLKLNWIMAGISFLILPLSLFTTRYIRGKSNVAYEKKRDLQGRYNNFMINTMFFWKEIKSNRLEEKQQEIFLKYWKDMGEALVQAHIFWFLNRSFIAFKDTFLTKMGLYLIGGILVIYELATVPILLTFMEYYSGFVERLIEMSDIKIMLGEQEESFKRVEEVLSSPSKYKKEYIEHFENLQIRKIYFSYQNQKVLDEFSLHIDRGETVAIIGKSGSGKSTLIKIMAGFLKPQCGEVLWNGKRMEDISRNELYKKIGFLMQDSRLFNLSIRENLQFGKQDASEQEMIEACQRANIWTFIKNLPMGLETLIGENGVRLSGGQKQRIQIARLFLHDPEVVIFDEATSALDYKSEKEILDILLENLQGKTFIMVTHRENLIARCNQIIRIERERGEILV